MRTLTVFNHVSLDGYFTDAQGGMGFAHNLLPDPEWAAFVEANAAGGGELVFGRHTYAMMAAFWPTPEAAARMPSVAECMNALPKVVFSRTLDRAAWRNTRVLKGELGAEVQRLKAEPGAGLVVLGSGSLVAQLAALGLIDELHLVLNPVVLGGGRSLFEGVAAPRPWTLLGTRAFANGNVLLRYAPQP